MVLSDVAIFMASAFGLGLASGLVFGRVIEMFRSLAN